MEIELTKNRFVGFNHPPYVMAEIGINHNGDFDIAKQMIIDCKKAGADAVKFQKRTLDEMYTKENLNKPYLKESSFGSTYGLHKEFLEFSNEQLIDLKKIADNHKITFIVSGFDISGFNFIENQLNVPFHKIASPLVTHYPLLEHVARFKKPMIISTGMHNYEEVKDMLKMVRKINKKIILLQCTTSYPTPDEDVNLNVLNRYIKDFNILSGYSSHDRGVVIAAASVALGGCFIEKHYTFDRMAKGPDHVSSVEDRGLELIVKYSNSIFNSLGSDIKELSNSEISNRVKHGYSCVSAFNLKKGTKIDENMLKYKQPGGGFLPSENQKIIGNILSKDIKKDHVFSYDDF